MWWNLEGLKLSVYIGNLAIPMYLCIGLWHPDSNEPLWAADLWGFTRQLDSDGNGEWWEYKLAWYDGVCCCIKVCKRWMCLYLIWVFLRLGPGGTLLCYACNKYTRKQMQHCIDMMKLLCLLLGNVTTCSWPVPLNQKQKNRSNLGSIMIDSF